jgi:hypothetical protein
MKLVHKTWNNEVVNDAIVKSDLHTISQGTMVMADDENIRLLLPSGKHTTHAGYSNRPNNNNRKKKKRPNPNNPNPNNPNSNFKNNPNRPHRNPPKK